MILPKKTCSIRENFFYLLILTGFFVFVELSFFIQCNHAYLADFSFVTDHLQLPKSILPGIIFYLFAQLLVHFLFCLFAWSLATAISNKLSFAIMVWILCLMTVLSANQYYFPNSKFSELNALMSNPTWIQAIFYFCALSIALLASVALACSRSFRVLFVILLSIAAYYYLKQTPITNDHIATKERPNIIIVGIDSLRPDYLGFFGNDIDTPFIDSLLKQSMVFSEAVTPLARTFPSWTSILTGEHPKEIGLRSNLSPQHQADFSQSLPASLRQLGYETIYATDETRFSNIDKNYGFDAIITPPIGLNDFLLGTFNDFPISNLLVNSVIGKWLFPHSYANRAAFITYQPDSFLRLIEPAIQQSRTKPLFLAIHFCLPHHPYLWADLSGHRFEPLSRYTLSIQRVDQQLHDFFTLLSEAHLLDHAIVVLLSDHGEALQLRGDRLTTGESYIGTGKKNTPPHFYPPGLEEQQVDQSVGHGTDVLSLSQYHTLLAFKLFGTDNQQKTIPGVVSLLAIKPTILELIENKSKNNSLARIIKNQSTSVAQTAHIFIESDFTPQAIRTVYPETREVMLEGIQIFEIDPYTARLTVKHDMGLKIIKSKQVADIYGHWMLALYPQNNQYRMPILINLKTGTWTNDLRSRFAQNSPAKEMLAKIRTFYGNDLE